MSHPAQCSLILPISFFYLSFSHPLLREATSPRKANKLKHESNKRGKNYNDNNKKRRGIADAKLIIVSEKKRKDEHIRQKWLEEVLDTEPLGNRLPVPRAEIVAHLHQSPDLAEDLERPMRVAEARVAVHGADGGLHPFLLRW